MPMPMQLVRASRNSELAIVAGKFRCHAGGRRIGQHVVCDGLLYAEQQDSFPDWGHASTHYHFPPPFPTTIAIENEDLGWMHAPRLVLDGC